MVVVAAPGVAGNHAGDEVCGGCLSGDDGNAVLMGFFENAT